MGQVTDDDITARIAAIRDDFIRFNGHVIGTLGPVRVGPLANPQALGRIQYAEGGPVIYYDDRLPPKYQLAILEAAYQVMISGGQDLDWLNYDLVRDGVTRSFRYFDITPEWLITQSR